MGEKLNLLTLDSNILISYLNADAAIVKCVEKWRKKRIKFVISALSEVEVLSLSELTESDIRKIERLLREFTIVNLDSQIGRIAAEIRRTYLLGLGDSVIAATAKITNSVLATQDKRFANAIRGYIRLETLD